MARVWWYARDGAKHGPIPKEGIERLIDQGVITPDTLLWSEGLEKWQKLSALQTPQPPPLPGSESAANTETGALSEPQVREIRISIGTPASAGRRYFARLIDLWILSFVVALAAGAGLSLASDEFAFWIQRPESDAIFALGARPLYAGDVA